MTYTIHAKDEASTLLASAPAASVEILEGNWYFDRAAVQMGHLVVTERTYTCPYKGVCYWVDLELPGLNSRNIAWVYENPKPGYEMIAGRIAFYARETSATRPVQAARELK